MRRNEKSTRRSRWRRRAANLFILTGLLVLLYPVGTWAYTWHQQRALEQDLVREHPALAGDVADHFEDGPGGARRVGVRRDGLGGPPGSFLDEEHPEKPSLRTEHEQQVRLFRERAEAFAEELVERGGEPIAKISIPKIDADVVVIQGTGTDDLREGPGHWPETPPPGLGGNFVVSGHRTTYGAPFFRLDQLEKGDIIRVALPYGAVEYVVTRSLVVSPDAVEVVAQRGVEEISLTTCDPIYSAAQRLVVQAELSSFKLLEEQAGEARQAVSG